MTQQFHSWACTQRDGKLVSKTHLHSHVRDVSQQLKVEVLQVIHPQMNGETKYGPSTRWKTSGTWKGGTLWFLWQHGWTLWTLCSVIELVTEVEVLCDPLRWGPQRSQIHRDRKQRGVCQRPREGKCLTGTELQLQKLRQFGRRQQWSLHNSVNVPDAAEPDS